MSMSVTTRRGDDGMTDLLFGRRVPKTHLRLAALGDLDELNCALGLARAAGLGPDSQAAVDAIQHLLVALMGLVACHADDAGRHADAGLRSLEDADVAMLEELTKRLEQSGINPGDWARPGANAPLAAAALDQARAISRRSERSAWRVHHDDGPLPPAVLLFLNRLSDTLWLLARAASRTP
jgi:cob(I)alamin adenosyltransferase